MKNYREKLKKKIFFPTKQKGFTLLELLVVIAIIGLLASVVLVSFPSAMKKVRDAQRLQDVSQIITALEVYKANNGSYPPISSDSCCDGWDQGPCDTNPFIEALVTSDSATIVPVDPAGGSGTGCYGYNYYRYSASSYSCDVSRGAFYVLGIRNMESSGAPYPDSPGWSCSGRDWQNEFDWVTGRFEK